MEEVSTHPKTRGARINIKDVPLYVGRARHECGEVASLCESIAKDCRNREVVGAARRLYQQAIRLGQAANALSAVPIGEALIWLPPRMSWRAKVRTLLILGFRIVTA